MNILAESYGHAVVLNVKGELTEDVLEAFHKAVAHQLANEGVIDVLLNCEKISFVDSAALEFLLDLQDRLVERLGQVKLISPDENVRKVLEITRLASSFETYDSLTEAVKAIRV